ncbi:MAG: HD domain-containing protein [Thermoleophilia bacterium]|nr:HD domain-containing protein [Thermoleophilia bacterium]
MHGNTRGADLTRLAQVKNHPDVVEFLSKADEYLGTLGYTEHGARHASLVAHIAHNILERLGYGSDTAELAAVAGYLHDVGNFLGREAHAQSAAIICYHVLRDLGFGPAEYAVIMGAIGNHDEQLGNALDPVSAALILADKSDVHRSRVRDPRTTAEDIHDRVNYAAERSFLNVDGAQHRMTLELTIDTTISGVMEYFEIFLSRMIMCRRAADFLGCTFQMEINRVKIF